MPALLITVVDSALEHTAYTFKHIQQCQVSLICVDSIARTIEFKAKNDE